MKGRCEFLKDTATGALILGSQTELGLVGMLDPRAETDKPEDRSHMEHNLPGQNPDDHAVRVRQCNRTSFGVPAQHQTHGMFCTHRYPCPTSTGPAPWSLLYCCANWHVFALLEQTL
jgi:hypothetical protein